jgi:hypothetical protein
MNLLKEYIIIWYSEKYDETFTKSKTHWRDVEAFVRLVWKKENPSFVHVYEAENKEYPEEWKQLQMEE